MEYGVYDPSKHPMVYVPPAVVFSKKNAPLDLGNVHLVDFANIWGTWGSSGMGEPAVKARGTCCAYLREPPGAARSHSPFKK